MEHVLVQLSMMSLVLSQNSFETELYGAQPAYNYANAYNVGRIYDIQWQRSMWVYRSVTNLVFIGDSMSSPIQIGDTNEVEATCARMVLGGNEYIDSYLAAWIPPFSAPLGIPKMSFRTNLGRIFDCSNPIYDYDDPSYENTKWVSHPGWYLSGFQWYADDVIYQIGFQFTQMPTPKPTPPPTPKPTPPPTPKPTPPPTPLPTPLPTLLPTLSPTPSPTNYCVDFHSHEDSQDGTNEYIIDDYSNYINYTQIQTKYYHVNSSRSMVINCTSNKCDDERMELFDFQVDSYFVECVTPKSCTKLSIDLAAESSLIWRCLSDSCEDAELNADDAHHVIIICNGTHSCYNNDIHISARDITDTTLFEMHCIGSLSCSNTQISVDNVRRNQSKIICYSTNSCDGLNIMTDSNYTQLVMYEYSDSISFYNGIGYYEPYNNVICSNEIEKRWLRYNTNSLKTNDDLVRIARHLYDQKLPCEGVTMYCGDRHCDVTYIFNISLDSMLDSEHSCYWFEFNRITQPWCDGLCDAFQYYIHQIVVQIQLNFQQSNVSYFCQYFFGEQNATKRSMETVDAIYNDALRIYYSSTSYRWSKYVRSIPNTSFSEINSSCNNSIYLFVMFEIRSINNDKSETLNNYKSGSSFYNATNALLQKYFGDTMVMVTTTVYQIIIRNVIQRGWFQQLMIDYFSVPLSIFWLFIWAITWISSCFHTKYFTRKLSLIYKYVVLYPVDSIKHTQIIAYAMRVFTNFISLYFIYQLIVVTVAGDLSAALISLNVICLVFLVTLPIISYCLNFKFMWIWKNCSMSKFYSDWIVLNSKKMWTLIAFSGSVQKSHGFMCSRLLGLKSCLCPLSVSDQRILQKFEFEDNYVLPRVTAQFMFQVIVGGINFDHAANPFEFSWLMAVIVFFLDVIVSIMDYKWQTMNRYEVKQFSLPFTISSRSEEDKNCIENRMYYFEHINDIIGDICNIDARLVDIYCVKLNFTMKSLMYYGTKPIKSGEIDYNRLVHETETLFGFENVLSVQQQSIVAKKDNIDLQDDDEKHLYQQKKQDTNDMSMLNSNDYMQYDSVSDSSLRFNNPLSLASSVDATQPMIPTQSGNKKTGFNILKWFKRK